MVEFGRRLQKALDYRGKKQIDIVENCGISKSNLSKYMIGKLPMPKLSTIQRICDYLDIAPTYLMGFSNDLFTPEIKPLNTLFVGEKTNKELLIEEIHNACTFLDEETLRNLVVMVKALRK